MSQGQGMLFPLVVLLAFASIMVAVIAYFRSEKEPPNLQRRLLPRFYAYAMLFISSLIVLVGGGLLVKAALSYPLRMEFSYRGRAVYAEATPQAPAAPTVVEEPEVERLWEAPSIEAIEYPQADRLRDVLNGATFVAVGGLFFGLHRAVRKRVESESERSVSFLNKAYLMVSAVVYGGLSLVLIPTGLYQLFEFYLVPRGELEETLWSRPVPGDILGYALVALALWLWVLPQLLKTLRLEESGE